MARLIEERVALCEVKRIKTKPIEEQLVRKPNPIKITQRDVDDLNRRIRKDAEEMRKRKEKGTEYAKDIIMR
jgi:hypothetical protein